MISRYHVIYTSRKDGPYNPGWVVVIENPETEGEPLLYLAQETKGTTQLAVLRLEERVKIVCVRR
jgi:restriction endonuclease